MPRIMLVRERQDSDSKSHQILKSMNKNKSKLILKLQNIKGKEKMSKATRMRRQITVKRKRTKLTATDDRRQWHLPTTKEKSLST